MTINWNGNYCQECGGHLTGNSHKWCDKCPTDLCEFCGEKFQKVRKSHRFCSKDCMTKWKSNKAREIRHCKHCGKEMEVRKITKTKYCSLHCLQQSRKFLPDTMPCEYCGKDFKVRTIRNRFCSHRCASDAQFTEKGAFEDFASSYRSSVGWRGIRRSILDRDDFTCQLCFRDHTSEWLHVHHIVSLRELWPFRIGDSERPSNLITLCEHCHPSVEAGNIECPEPKS